MEVSTIVSGRLHSRDRIDRSCICRDHDGSQRLLIKFLPQLKYFVFIHSPMNDIKQVVKEPWEFEFINILAGMFIADNESLKEKVFPQPDLHNWSWNEITRR